MNKKENFFTIGDKTKDGIISKFEIDSNGIRVFFEEKPENYHVSLNSINHVKTPLFKTEDNVNIYKGMNYFTVYKDKSSNTWTTQNNPFVADDDINFHIHNDVKYFSTKENAISYIIYNKPCLSVNDLLGVLGGTQNIDSLMKKIKHTI